MIPLTPARKDIKSEASTMKPVFTADFSTTSLSDWGIEQHVPDGYFDFVVRDNKLVFLDAGNRISPNAPSLESFVIRGAFDADWIINNTEFSFQIFFAYDAYKRQGLALEFGSHGEKLFVKLVSPAKHTIVHEVFEMPVIDGGVVDFEFEVKNGTIRFSLNSQEYLKFTLDQNCHGLIALTRGVFLGELRLYSLSIESEDPLDLKPIWENLHIPFAPINGMDIPIVWTVNATRIGSAVKIDVELSGGEKTRPDVPWFPYHCHYTEFLERPYLRIESEDSVSDLCLTEETLVLAIPRGEYFYIIANKNPQWPLRKTFYLTDVNDNSILFAGYKAYGNRSVNKHLEANTPYETAFDTRTDQIIYSGKSIARNAVAIDLQSPHDKQICKAIPETTHEYERALKSARMNHFFLEGEECQFYFEMFSRIGEHKEQRKLEYRVESAFFDIQCEYRELTIDRAIDHVALDIDRIHSEKINLGAMPPGVYHIRFRLFSGPALSEENYRAFEVIGKTASGASASRLPVCFSMTNEVKAQDTDNFDPWRCDCTDVSHYISICSSIMPHFVREKRFWTLLKLYKRQWFLWLNDRVMENYSIENNHDLIANCDYIDLHDRDSVYRLCCRQFYTKPVLEILYSFALEHNFKLAEIKSFIDNDTIPDKETFDALVNECLYQWTDFHWNQRIKDLTAFKARVDAINPNAKTASYGPAAVYVGVYKTAHTLNYAGSYKSCKEMEGYRDGYYMLEDYPHVCRYSIHSGPFFLSSFKAIAPHVTVYPEMYNETGDNVPCPDAAVARAFPSYGMWGGNLPINASMKVVLEYVFACMWHDGTKFNYWKDYGFHTRAWERERFEALLKVWGFIDKHPPMRPLKTNAFVCNDDCCRNHKLYYDEYPGDSHEGYGDLFNTAEECSAFSYEMSRTAGQNAGFVTDFDNLSSLTAADIDTLVIPPLTKVSEGTLRIIRRLHEQGVSLLGFEEVAGLEDLFGVTETDPVQVNNIKVNQTLPNNPLHKLCALTEYTEHRACMGKYQATTAQVLLEAEIPVLLTNQTKWGKTALYNIPPTAVRRQDQLNRIAYGRASISKLINESTKLVFRYLSNPTIETTEGKIIAFEDIHGQRHIIIEEDAYPFPAKTIHPILTIAKPGLRVENIACDKAFRMVSSGDNTIRISLTLEPNEFAIISLG